MSTRRSRFEIYVDILKEIMGGATKPTKIMYGANLSYKPLKEILRSMLDQGLNHGTRGAQQGQEDEGDVRVDHKGRERGPLLQQGQESHRDIQPQGSGLTSAALERRGLIDL